MVAACLNAHILTLPFCLLEFSEREFKKQTGENGRSQG